jgi:hypothetical protein
MLWLWITARAVVGSNVGVFFFSGQVVHRGERVELGKVPGRPTDQEDRWPQAQPVSGPFRPVTTALLIVGACVSLTGITKLADANNAGTRNASQCTLILTEGDSAKALAVAGLGVVGRDNFGVFPLRGKLLNVREAKHDQIMKNEEIQNIKKIMGLQHNKDYSDVGSLRYGQLMIMTDQASVFFLSCGCDGGGRC